MLVVSVSAATNSIACDLTGTAAAFTRGHSSILAHLRESKGGLRGPHRRRAQCGAVASENVDSRARAVYACRIAEVASAVFDRGRNYSVCMKLGFVRISRKMAAARWQSSDAGRQRQPQAELLKPAIHFG